MRWTGLALILSAVAALYGLKVSEADSNQQLGRFIAQEIGGEPVVGDQVMVAACLLKQC